MHPRSTMLVLALTALVACGGDGDDDSDQSGFCEQFQAIGQDVTDLATTAPDDIGSQLDQLDDLEPPDEIADAYRNLVDAYDTLADSDAITDPAIAADLSQAQTSLTEIETYIQDNCDP